METKVPYSKAKDITWNLCGTENPMSMQTEQATLAVLMDIRAQLKQLNAVFACPNAPRIPHILDKIAVNTRKPKKRKKKI